MKQFWKTLWKRSKRCLFPGWKLAFPLVLISTVFLVYIFTHSMDGTPMAYGAYILSFYALIAGTEAATRIGLALWKRIKVIPLVDRWRTDAYFRARLSLILSFFISLCYAGLRMVSAARYTSFWDGALGGYYVLLCVIRLYLLRWTPSSESAVGQAEQYRTRRRAGWLLLILDLILTWIAYQIVQEGRGYHYPGTLIYAYAAYAFYALISASILLVRYRRFNSPVLSAAKSVNLTSGIVAIFSLETAMMDSFGGDEAFWDYMLPGTAAVMCALVLLIAVFMIRSGTGANEK